jgi:hypothetical protein
LKKLLNRAAINYKVTIHFREVYTKRIVSIGVDGVRAAARQAAGENNLASYKLLNTGVRKGGLE